MHKADEEAKPEEKIRTLTYLWYDFMIPFFKFSYIFLAFLSLNLIACPEAIFQEWGAFNEKFIIITKTKL